MSFFFDTMKEEENRYNEEGEEETDQFGEEFRTEGLEKMINHVAFKNEKLMKTYKEVHPDYNNPESNRSDQYSKMVIEAMDCDEDHRAQIIRLLSKATSIQRAEAMALTLH